MPRETILDPAATLAGQRTIQAFSRYYFLTVRQLNVLLGYSPQSNHVDRTVRKLVAANRLTVVATNQKVPDRDGRVKPGAVENIYGLRQRGNRDQRKSPIFLSHLIAVNDVLIAAERYAALTPGVSLRNMIHDLDFRERQLSTMPDGYLDLVLADGEPYGILLELDRGTESFNDPKQSTTWEKKITGLIHLLSGEPEAVLGSRPDIIAVVVRSGGIGTKQPEERLRELVHWTERVITELAPQHIEAWAEFFLFTAADPTTMSETEFLTGEHWVKPFTYEWMPLVPVGS